MDHAVDEESDISMNSTESEEHGDEDYGIDQVLAEKTEKDGTKRWFVSWDGYESDENLWLPAENFNDPMTLYEWAIKKQQIDQGLIPAYDVDAWIERQAERERQRIQKKEANRIKRDQKRGELAAKLLNGRWVDPKTLQSKQKRLRSRQRKSYESDGDEDYRPLKRLNSGSPSSESSSSSSAEHNSSTDSDEPLALKMPKKPLPQTKKGGQTNPTRKNNSAPEHDHAVAAVRQFQTLNIPLRISQSPLPSDTPSSKTMQPHAPTTQYNQGAAQDVARSVKDIASTSGISNLSLLANQDTSMESTGMQYKKVLPTSPIRSPGSQTVETAVQPSLPKPAMFRPVFTGTTTADIALRQTARRPARSKPKSQIIFNHSGTAVNKPKRRLSTRDPFIQEWAATRNARESPPPIVPEANMMSIETAGQLPGLRKIIHDDPIGRSESPSLFVSQDKEMTDVWEEEAILEEQVKNTMNPAVTEISAPVDPRSKILPLTSSGSNGQHRLMQDEQLRATAIDETAKPTEPSRMTSSLHPIRLSGTQTTSPAVGQDTEGETFGESKSDYSPDYTINKIRGIKLGNLTWLEFQRNRPALSGSWRTDCQIIAAASKERLDATLYDLKYDTSHRLLRTTQESGRRKVRLHFDTVCADFATFLREHVGEHDYIFLDIGTFSLDRRRSGPEAIPWTVGHLCITSFFTVLMWPVSSENWSEATRRLLDSTQHKASLGLVIFHSRRGGSMTAKKVPEVSENVTRNFWSTSNEPQKTRVDNATLVSGKAKNVGNSHEDAGMLPQNTSRPVFRTTTPVQRNHVTPLDAEKEDIPSSSLPPTNFEQGKQSWMEERSSEACVVKEKLKKLFGIDWEFICRHCKQGNPSVLLQYPIGDVQDELKILIEFFDVLGVDWKSASNRGHQQSFRKDVAHRSSWVDKTGRQVPYDWKKSVKRYDGIPAVILIHQSLSPNEILAGDWAAYLRNPNVRAFRISLGQAYTDRLALIVQPQPDIHEIAQSGHIILLTDSIYIHYPRIARDIVEYILAQRQSQDPTQPKLHRLYTRPHVQQWLKKFIKSKSELNTTYEKLIGLLGRINPRLATDPRWIREYDEITETKQKDLKLIDWFASETRNELENFRKFTVVYHGSTAQEGLDLHTKYKHLLCFEPQHMMQTYIYPWYNKRQWALEAKAAAKPSA